MVSGWGLRARALGEEPVEAVDAWQWKRKKPSRDALRLGCCDAAVLRVPQNVALAEQPGVNYAGSGESAQL